MINRRNGIRTALLGMALWQTGCITSIHAEREPVSAAARTALFNHAPKLKNAIVRACDSGGSRGGLPLDAPFRLATLPLRFTWGLLDGLESWIGAEILERWTGRRVTDETERLEEFKKG